MAKSPNKRSHSLNVLLIAGCAIVQIKSDFTLKFEIKSPALPSNCWRTSADSAYASRSPIPRNYISAKLQANRSLFMTLGRECWFP